MSLSLSRLATPYKNKMKREYKKHMQNFKNNILPCKIKTNRTD